MSCYQPKTVPEASSQSSHGAAFIRGLNYRNSQFIHSQEFVSLSEVQCMVFSVNNLIQM